MKKTVLFGDEDVQNLSLAGEVLADQTDEILDLWYGYVGGNAHLVHYFTHNGQPNMDYLGAVRKRFSQWILDLCCRRPYDQDWLQLPARNRLRHHSTKKNQTDGVEAIPPFISATSWRSFSPSRSPSRASWRKKGILPNRLRRCTPHGSKP
ncbi:MAG: protoglobin domain-containing protein [Saprospiraceae bacterium]